MVISECRNGPQLPVQFDDDDDDGGDDDGDDDIDNVEMKFTFTFRLHPPCVLTTDTAPVKRLYCCVTHFHFPAAFYCGCNLEVAMTFILNNNNTAV